MQSQHSQAQQQRAALQPQTSTSTSTSTGKVMPEIEIRFHFIESLVRRKLVFTPGKYHIQGENKNYHGQIQ